MVGMAFLWAPSVALAVDYTWASLSTGGTWTTTTNWTPNGNPGTGDTALLGTTSGVNRTVVYGTASSGTLGTLTFSQSASGTNTLETQRSVGVANGITLGATTGVARLLLGPLSGTTSTSTALTVPGGVTVNAGGVLAMGGYNPTATSVGLANVTGNVTVQGGLLNVDTIVKAATATSAMSVISGTLTMTSGTILLSSTTGGVTDRRLSTQGSLNITGGAIDAVNSGAQFVTEAPANVLQPTTFNDTRISFSMLRNGDQTVTTSTTPNVVARGTGVKMYTSTISGTNFSYLQIVDGNNATPSSRTTFTLGSNLTLLAGKNMPAASNLSAVEPTTLRMDLGLDAAAYTLNLTSNSGVWTPGTPFAVGTGTTTYWAITGTAGSIIANGFKFDTAGVATSVGPGLVLESRAGNGVANVLSLGSGTGVIDSTSAFRYSGTAAVGTPSTLASTRSIGDLEVTSGALQLSSLAGLQAVRVSSGGTLDLGGLSLSVTSGSFGGTVTNGTLTTTAGGYTATSGTISASLTGTAGLAKSGATTLLLSGSNAFTGGLTITGGTVQAGTADSFGPSGTITMAGGGIAYGSGVTTDFSSRFATSANQTFAINVGGNAVTQASSLVSGGTSSLTRSGAGLLVLTGPASSIGTQGITVNGGTTVIDPGSGGTFASAGRLYVGSLSGASLLRIASGSVSVAPGAGTYINIADNASATATLEITGGSTTFSLANVRMMVGNKGTGTLQVSSGTLTVTGGNPIYVGGDQQFSTNTAVGTLTVSGGLMEVTGSGAFVIGHSGTGNPGSSGTLNLDGGELRTIRPITRSGAVGTVNFNGGRLVPLASSTTFLQGLTAANVLGGAVIDTNGFDITIGQALLGTGTGGLAKSGAGTLRLTGASTYTGPTGVAAGRLLVDGSLLGATSVSVLSAATLGGSGTIAGAVAVLGGTLSPGASPGALSIASLSLDASSTTLMEITGTTAGSQYDQVVLSGSVAYGGGMVLDLSQTFADSTTFDLFKDFTSFSGNLASLTSVGSAYNGVTFTRAGDVWTSTQSGGQTLEFSQATGVLIVVPEPASMAAVGLAAVAALAAGRRRR
jgi:autotransporter-associated beta strand protein